MKINLSHFKGNWNKVSVCCCEGYWRRCSHGFSDRGHSSPLAPLVPHKSSPSSNPQARACGISVHPSRPRLRTFLPTNVSDAQEASLWWELHPPSRSIYTALDYISQGASRSRLLSVERSRGACPSSHRGAPVSWGREARSPQLKLAF